MAFGLDFPGGNVSEMNSFYSGHSWPSSCLDVNNNDDYARDSSNGEGLNISQRYFKVAGELNIYSMCFNSFRCENRDLKHFFPLLQGIMLLPTGRALTPSAAGSAQLSTRRS